MNVWQTVLLVVATLCGGVGLSLAIEANSRLDAALKRKPITELAQEPVARRKKNLEPVQESPPFTIDDVTEMLQRSADFYAGKARERAAVEQAGAASRYGDTAADLAQKAAMYRYLLRQVQITAESEATR